MNSRTLSGIVSAIVALVSLAPPPGVAATRVEEWPLSSVATIVVSDMSGSPVFTGDYDMDTWLEIYQFAGTGYWTALAEEVSSGFEIEVVGIGPQGFPWCVGDGDGDGLADMVFSDSSSGLVVVEAVELGEFPSAIVFDAGYYWASREAQYADLDQDGLQEIVIMGVEDTVYVYECTGDNAYDWLGSLPLHGAFGGFAIDDFDRDDRMDLVVGDSAGYVSCFEQREGALPELTWEQELSVGGRVTRVAPSDFDLDGAAEILVNCHESDNSQTILALDAVGDDDYAVGIVTRIDSGSAHGSVYAGNISGHAWPDIAVGRKESEQRLIEMFWADSGLVFTKVAYAVPPDGYDLTLSKGFPLADFDHDGIDEIMWPTWTQDGAIFKVDYSADVQAPWTEQVDPPAGSWFPLGTGSVEVIGESADDHAGIRTVEASHDAGETWQLLSVYPEWTFTVELPEDEVVEVLIRATDCSNKVEEPPFLWWGYSSASSPTPTGTPTLIPTLTPPPTSTATASPAATPVIEGVDLVLPQSHFRPGDSFWLGAVLGNPGPAETGVPLAIVLDVFGDYWFWPSWSRFDPASGAGVDLAYVALPTGASELPVVEPFTWPDTGGEVVEGLRCLGALLTSDLAGLRGRLDVEVWGYGP